MGVAALAMTLVGSAVSSMGAMQNAQGQAAAANYQAKVAESNQTIAQQNAAFAGAEGDQQAAIKEQQTRQQVGAIEAAQGSSGVDINSESAKATRTSQETVGALDAQTIRSNAARQAYGYETQANNYGNAASADKSQASNDITAGYMGAAGSLLSGAGNAAMNYAGAMNKASGLVGSSVNPASSNAAANASYDQIDNFGAGSF